MHKLNKITVCLDMAGCPNRCKHCWIGISNTKPMKIHCMTDIAEAFRKFASEFSIHSWYREPDFRADYKRLFELENQLSTNKKEHYELASFWRIVRDSEYVKWLYDVGVRKCQLTLFGDEDTTDFYVGRKGAYREILSAINILLDHNIAPRIQLFVNQDNISKMDGIVTLCREMDIEKRCMGIHQKFELFVHAGSCDGENKDLYHVRVEPDDLLLLPEYIIDKTLDYMKGENIQEIFGYEEKKYCNEALDWEEYSYTVSEEPVFYIDGNYDVYPNATTPYTWWKIGNLLKDGCCKILNRYKTKNFFAAEMIEQTSFEELISLYGNKESKKLFTQEDYYYYMINMYLEGKFKA